MRGLKDWEQLNCGNEPSHFRATSSDNQLQHWNIGQQNFPCFIGQQIFPALLDEGGRHFHTFPTFVLNSPPTQSIVSLRKTIGDVPCIWGVAMGTNPPNGTHDRRDESRPRADENSEDDIVSLLEENARLRGLVVKLSDLVLRSVVERR
jgi:hypothetical protein